MKLPSFLPFLARVVLLISFILLPLLNEASPVFSSNSLSLVTNTRITTQVGMPVVITAEYLQVSDGISDLEDLVFTLAQLPTNGRLRLDGQDLQENDTFTQADIEAGRFVYLSDSSEGGPDAFGFTFSSPNEPAIERVSVGTGRIQANRASYNADMTADGRQVVFSTRATNFGTEDPQEYDQIYVHDRLTGETVHISKTQDGHPGKGYPRSPFISATGDFVTYSSNVPNLTSVPRPTGSSEEAYLYDRTNNLTEMMWVDQSNFPPNWVTIFPTISEDGQFLALWSAGYQFDSVWMLNRSTGQYICASWNAATQSCGHGVLPVISRSGQWVAFISVDGLLPEDQNQTTDVYLYDVANRSLVLASRTPQGSSGNHAVLDNRVPSISADGRFVSYASLASDLVDNDLNEAPDFFVFDQLTGKNELVTVNNKGEQADVVKFAQFPDITAISGDGRYIAFYSNAENLDLWDSNGEVDLFIRDRQAGTTRRVLIPRKPGATQDAFHKFTLEITDDGNSLLFTSDADWLVAGDTNGMKDVFLANTNQMAIFQIQVEEGSHSPQLKYNHGLSNYERTVSPITKSVLQAGGNLTYTLGSLPERGDLLLSGQVMQLGDSFSQLDIDQGNLVFSPKEIGEDNILLHLGSSPLIERISINAEGQASAITPFWFPSISYDGKYAIVMDTIDGKQQIFVRDLSQGHNEAVGPGWYGAISGDARYVVFGSNEPNLVPGIAPTNNESHLYRYDRVEKTYQIIDIDEFGKPSENGIGDSFSISFDGGKVLFSAVDSLLSDAPRNATYVWHVDTRNLELVSVAPDGSPLVRNWSVISGDGRYVVFEDYLRDLRTKSTIPLLFASNNTPLSISYDGRYIVSTVEDGVISGDQNGFMDIALYDQVLETYQLVSIADDGTPANGSSFLPTISPDGTAIGFSTGATNLGGSNAAQTAQVVVYDRLKKVSRLVSVSAGGQPGKDHSAYTAIPVGGKFVFFSSRATNLVPDGSNHVGVYRFNLETLPFNFQIIVNPLIWYYLPLISK